MPFKRKPPSYTGKGSVNHFHKTRSSRKFHTHRSLTYSHIQVQNPIEETKIPDSDEQIDKEALLGIRKESLQQDIDNGSAQFTENRRPRTFAEATMSRKATNLRKDGEAIDTSDSVSGTIGAASAKVTFKKKKKVAKWTPLDLSDIGTSFGSGSGSAPAPALQNTPKAAADPGFNPGTSEDTKLGAEVGSGNDASAEPIAAVKLSPDGVFESNSSGDLAVETKETDDTRGGSEFSKVAARTESTDVPAQNIEVTNPFSSQQQLNSLSPVPSTNAASTLGSGIPSTFSPESAFESAVEFLADSDLETHTHSPQASAFTLQPVESDEVSDTQSVKDRFEAAASRITEAFPSFEHEAPISPSLYPTMGRDDGFDTLEWDPNLPPASENNSPEPVNVNLQPLAYTTVGSLVNPSVVPQFAAPNRIQREGAGRRMQTSRDYQDPHFQRRLTGNLLNNATQQHPFGTHAPPYPLTRASSHAPQPDEEENLLRLEGLTVPRVRAGNGMGRLDSLFDRHNDQKAGVKRPFDGENEQVATLRNDMPGMGKMQTLQRLANYDNPHQEVARNRLSELAASKAEAGSILGKTVGNPTGYTESNNENDRRVADRDVYFQPTVMGSGSQQTNPLHTAPQARSSQPLRNSYNPPPGYPQPLTAGPPGQRTSNPAFHATSSVPRISELVKNLRTTQDPNAYDNTDYGTSTNIDSSATFQSRSPWSPNIGIVSNQHQPSLAARPLTVEDRTKPIDTLPMAAVQQYYPNGFPKNMDGTYTPLPQSVRDEMDRSAFLSSADAAKERQAQKDKELDDWFYSGQRKYAMTPEEHICELERSSMNPVAQPRSTNPFGPIGPPKKPRPPVNNEPYTVEQMNDMSPPEAAEPLLGAVFGSLLEYAERGPNSRAKKSGFTSSPAWHIDSSEKGNESFFGDDGAPPPHGTGQDLQK